MAISSYYGEKKATTFLDVYSEKADGTRILHSRIKDQEAYDAACLTLRFNEIFQCRQLMKNHHINFEDIPRKEKNIFVYNLLACSPHISSVFELGSSLFELIDGLELVHHYVINKKSATPVVLPKEYKYIGIEISEIQGEGSKYLHENYDLNILESTENISDTKNSLLYDRNVTSYAFDNVHDLSSFFNSFDIVFSNLYISRDGTFSSALLGKKHTYFDLETLLAKLNKPLFHLFGERAPGIDRDNPLKNEKKVI